MSFCWFSYQFSEIFLVTPLHLSTPYMLMFFKYSFMFSTLYSFLFSTHFKDIYFKHISSRLPLSLAILQKAEPWDCIRNERGKTREDRARIPPCKGRWVKKIWATLSVFGPWESSRVNILRTPFIRDECKIWSRNYRNNSKRSSST